MAKRDYYTTGEVAKLMGVHRKTALRLGKKGGIPGMYDYQGRFRWVREVIDAHKKGLDSKRRRAASET